MAANRDLFEIKFWGTRGTLPVFGDAYANTGGHTNCIELTCGSETIILDAGTGLRHLGPKLVAEKKNRAHLLLTHAHYDHVEGIPFFDLMFNEEASIDVYCGPLDGASGGKDVFEKFMSRPLFPVTPDIFCAEINYLDLVQSQSFTIGSDIEVQTVALSHPGGATGYRVNYKSKSFACITDTEHNVGAHDEAIMKLIDGVDMFVYDCSHTDEEFEQFIGFGHSTIEEGARLCKLANAGALKAFHHIPQRTDAELAVSEKIIQEINPKNSIAREGEVVEL